MIVTSSLHEYAEHHRVRRVAVACGVFDGVHLGHQKIIQALLEMADREQALPAVLTFAPHPRAVLTGHGTPLALTNREQQLEILAELGVEATVIINFTPAVAELSPRQFLCNYFFAENLSLAGICVGAGWRFGAGGRGDTGDLREMGRDYGFRVVTVSELYWYGSPVSSTRIRGKINQGKLSAAARMLGRWHAVRGRVVRGRGIGGSDLQCPTANLMAEGLLLPPPAVYAVQVAVDTDLQPSARTCYGGIAYVGSAPTVAGSAEGVEHKTRLECHLFESAEQLYRREIEVRFIRFIRPGFAFPDTSSLAQQIEQDIEAAKQVSKSLL